ncbi:MAG: hypothetical protein Aurels2KO_42770 [Aureliella sp.]
MVNILRNCFAAIVGIVTGGLAVLLIESLSSLAHPKPDYIDLSDADAMRDWIQSLPLTAFAAVLAAWSVGAFVGVWVARMLSANRSIWPAIVAGAFLLLATIGNLVMIPHPLWFAVLGIAVYPVFGLLGLAFSTPGEMIVSAERDIGADKSVVFKTLADIKNFSKAVPEIVNVEFLTEQQYGIGTRFHETRMMNGREAKTELEVTELVEDEHVRLVSTAGGTLWDTVFTVASGQAGSTHMQMSMSCQPQTFFAKIFVPVILPMVSKFVQADMDAVKTYCETSS